MEHVIIKDKKYSLETLKLLTGQQEMEIKEIPHTMLVIAEAVDGPDKLPYLLETIKSLEIDDMEKFRYVLLRVQIDSELHMNEDIQKYHKRLFVSQVIEKLLYGELLFEAGKDEDENDE
jgi:predicted component of type VI protein secretion system